MEGRGEMKKKLITAVLSVIAALFVFICITDVINEDVYADGSWWNNGSEWCLNMITQQIYGDSSDGTYSRVADEVFKITDNTVQDETSTDGKKKTAVLSEHIEKKEDNTVTKNDSDDVLNLIKAPLSEFDTTTPSIGDVKAIVVEVEFPDLGYSDDCLQTDELKEAIFGEEDRASIFYPLESVSAYYKRASYGNMSIDGDVYTYTAKNPRNYYSEGKEYETLVMETLQALDEQIDYSDYDSNKDGYIDCISFNVPINGTSDDDFWYGCQATWYINPEFSVDGISLKGYVINDEQPLRDDMKTYNATLCHEIGHLMGLPDYYKYNTPDDWEGLNGEAGYERMDDSWGDFGAFSKLMLGWFRQSDVSICDLSQGSSTYILRTTSSEQGGNMIIVPVGELDENYFSEYFVIEYITPENNNYGIFDDGGIRVFHVDAEAITDENNEKKSFKYNNFSKYYDTTDKGIRVISLVNDNNGFYTSGSIVEFGTDNFGMYDENGHPTVEPGFKIDIGELVNGQYTVTITTN